MTPMSTTAEDVWAALRGVIDPCSLVNGTKLSLVDLGMIDDVVVAADGTVQVALLLDDPLCLYMGPIHQEIRDKIAEAVPDAPVEITIRGDVIWTSEHATEQTRQKIAEWQHQRRERLAARRPVPLAQPRLRTATNEE
jgi:metal-sulfur cluster biosynthetic enzyme